MAKILVVDDSKVVAKLLTTSLTAQGYDTINVQSVDAAIASLDEHKTAIKLVITDMIMPERDGMDLIDHLHTKINPFDRPKTIVISGGSASTVNAETAVMAVRERVDLVLIKPFTQDVLLKAVKQLIG